MVEHEMTTEQAIDHLSVLFERMDSENEEIPVYDIALEAVEMAIENLEKEIPKNVAQPKELVRYGMGERYDDYGCPLCGTFLASEPQGNQQKCLTRCWKCGQIVKWGE